MIPYADLVAALRHWRARNGLPIAGGDLGPPPAAYVPTLPGPAPVQSRPAYGSEYGDYGQETMDAEELGVQEIEGEEIYENQGSDFAMGFAGSGEPPPPPEAGAYPTDSQFSSAYNESYGGPTTDASTTDPDRYGGASDDFAAEPAPIKPQGIIVDPDTHDTTVPDEDAPPPAGKKKKRRR